MAIKYFDSLAQELGVEEIKRYFLSEIHEVLVEVTRFVWDPPHHEELLGLSPTCIEAKDPFISRDKYTEALEALQVNRLLCANLSLLGSFIWPCRVLLLMCFLSFRQLTQFIVFKECCKLQIRFPCLHGQGKASYYSESAPSS